MAKIEKGPHGDCATEGGSEWRKDAGDEGGAEKWNGIIGACVEFTVAAASVPEAVLPVTRTACPMRFRLLPCPKHQYMFNQLPQLFFCKKQTLSHVL